MFGMIESIGCSKLWYWKLLPTLDHGKELDIAWRFLIVL